VVPFGGRRDGGSVIGVCDVHAFCIHRWDREGSQTSRHRSQCGARGSEPL
jgi:hypothetical protein